MLWIAMLVSFVMAMLITPLVRRFAYLIGAVDHPNARKVHVRTMPRIGGLAIFIAFLIGYALLLPASRYNDAILIGAVVIVLTGLIDDRFQLSARVKLMGQMIATVVVLNSGMRIEMINLPFDQQLYLGSWSIPVTVLWLIGITNAINLIDGLDGLAAGVSSIALGTIAVLAIIQGNVYLTMMALLLLASTLGFLVHNFYPAKIFMGDTGALFLGYMLAVFSLIGFKNVTLFSLVVPVLLLGLPISDTIFAIVRRLVQGRPPMSPDKSHMHHQLIDMGFTTRQAVLLMYGMTLFFGIASILFAKTTMLGAVITFVIVLIVIELIVESTELIHPNYKPLIQTSRRLLGRTKAAD
ncbi:MULTISPECIES: glycosyltransferase family 4 protein [Exiguobacterium]|uniref:Undecaprenyl/decaprenyl-phosphate alpha-N-acetylglucosaminyl 1-phosphate transferase n=1 Tax=Exiguobacterium alkaliphilum TaxID=1428684 RepID=A0ABT2KV75_9BACL|nr:MULTISPECIES: MraY family glycosyltransferase [Exiguobacterium]MCT4794869.1 undecaprenyl/decaprenyl-phosphate alpha-N-acetylglucosaminyl 1-phosphate transferase [Exiguobacterium alkaliphilum]QUE87396.1 undecaprenyl/decaprenyl-phosphate alpha-N-acetylglucosaminyl 1-phosphate transferase [Exiguobacterium alkaliphilum]